MFNKACSKIDGRNCILVTGLGFYNLQDTMECGKCFRYERIEREDMVEYVTVVREMIIDVGQRQIGELIFFNMSDEEFESVARTYFALDNDLEEIRMDVVNHTDSVWLKKAAEVARGIAILKQDPFETLISFIISQNNNIPRIRKIIRQICSHYGVNITLHHKKYACPFRIINGTPCEEICRECGRCYTFPSAEDILSDPEGLLPSKPGFRYSYILDACQRVNDGTTNLDMIAIKGSYNYTVEKLKEIRGVGDKVASCVALFGFANLDAFPIDVWMKRAIDTYFDGVLDPVALGKYAGVAQQYIFHYIRNIENK